MPDSSDSKNTVKKLLAANRSEIATRIFRGATELGLRTVAIMQKKIGFVFTGSRLMKRID